MNDSTLIDEKLAGMSNRRGARWALMAALLGGCSAAPPGLGPVTQPSAEACLVQNGRTIDAPSLRAIGTEPFWGARIEGRCVTYSHPEDQQGTRVWTRYTATAQGGLWSGTLGGKLFELRTRRQPGCSDGMSDKLYPIAVELRVAGDSRTGCAEPL
jgi:uncharacterized membrane protein